MAGGTLLLKGRRVPDLTDPSTPTDTANLATVPAPLVIKLPQICEIFSYKPSAFVDMLHLTEIGTSINKHVLRLLSKPIHTLNLPEHCVITFYYE